METIATTVSDLDGAINVEMGWVALIMHRNDLVSVLGPGRYSRYRLWRQGLPPTGLSFMKVRTASAVHSQRVAQVELSDGAFVDIDTTVRVRLRVEGDPVDFFRAVLGEYGLNFADVSATLAGQLVEESLRGSNVASSDLRREVGGVRALAGKRMEATDVFQIVEVVSLSVARWDPHQVRLRETFQEMELEEFRAVRTIEIEASTGNLRAQACLELSRQLGVDPLFVWDPEGFRGELAARRETLVALLGQYGQNLALLAEVMGVDAGALGSVLGTALGGTAAAPVSATAAGRQLGGVSGASAKLTQDAEVALLATRVEGVMGGVYRELMVDGDSLRLMIVVSEGILDGSAVSAVAEELLGHSVNVVAVRHVREPEALLRSVISSVLGDGAGPGDIQREAGELYWRVPAALSSSPIEGRFIAESVADVFETPPVVPYS